MNKHTKSLRKIRRSWWERLVALVERDWRGCSGGPWTRPTLHWRHENIPSLEICVCLLWTRPTMEARHILMSCDFYILHFSCIFHQHGLTRPTLHCRHNQVEIFPICWSGPALLCLWSHNQMCRILFVYVKCRNKKILLLTHTIHISSQPSQP